MRGKRFEKLLNHYAKYPMSLRRQNLMRMSHPQGQFHASQGHKED